MHAYKQSILASEAKAGARHLTDRRKFNRAVRQLRAGGILDRLFKKVPSPKEEESANSISRIPFGILVFWASWCKHCTALKPKLNQVISSDIAVRRFNVEERDTWPSDVSTIAKKEVNGVPTLLFVKDGVVVNKLIGDKTIDRLRKEIRESFPELYEDPSKKKECVKTCMRQKLDERMPRKSSGTVTNKKQIVDQIVQDCNTECK